MFIATKIYTYFFGKYVGKDHYGNCYYRMGSKKNNKERRWVIYKGIVEASKVPASWHMWLHYVTDNLPNENNNEPFVWQKPHQPNYTATERAYYPLPKEKRYCSNSSSYYEAWNPNSEGISDE